MTILYWGIKKKKKNQTIITQGHVKNKPKPAKLPVPQQSYNIEKISNSEIMLKIGWLNWQLFIAC